MPYERTKLIRLMGKETQLQVFGEYIFTLHEVADFFGVQYATARSWVKKGQLRAARVGRVYWVRGASLRGFLEERETWNLDPTGTPDSLGEDLIVANGTIE